MDRLQRERNALFKLHEINRAMSVEHDMDKLLNRIMDHALEITRAERGFVILRGPEGLEVRIARNIGKNAVDHPMFKVSRGIIDECWKSGHPVIIEDAQSDDVFRQRSSVTSLGLSSVACIPLRRQSVVVGVLYLDNRFRKGLFQAGDMLILETFADEAAVAIENARLIEKIENQRRELEKMNRRLEDSNRELTSEVKKKTVALERLERKLKAEPPRW